MVLWENDVDRLMEGKSYRFQKVTVREYGCVKYLSMSEGATTEEVSDIGEVASCDEEDEDIGGGQHEAQGGL